MKNSILIVEDNNDLQLLFQLVLESEGYEVVIANNGIDALDSIDAIRPQLILMDIMMPGVNGIEVARSIKQKQDYESLPILLVSAIDRLLDRQLDYSKANGILYKPFDLDELVNKVEHFTSDNRFEANVA